MNKTIPAQYIEKIVSGGQTGVDRAALDVALEMGIACGGWCPKGRVAEDGVIDERYSLQETPLQEYGQRTEWNVRDSDGTLILYFRKMAGGTALTKDLAKHHKKPCLTFNLSKGVDDKKFREWLVQNRIKILNVAGPREIPNSTEIYKEAKRNLQILLVFG